MMRYIACVPVRMNSKRVPKKNIKKIGEKTLIERSIETLNKVNKIEETYIYASDTSIKEHISKNVKYKFIKRKKFLDGDFITFKEIFSDFIKEDILDAEYIVMLNCTSPFVRPQTIEKMIESIERGSFDSAFAAKKIKNYCWYKGKPLNFNKNNVPRTQELEPIFVEISSLYIFNKIFFKREKQRTGNKPYIQEVGEIEAIDIDTLEDFNFAKKIAKNEKL